MLDGILRLRSEACIDIPELRDDVQEQIMSLTLPLGKLCSRLTHLLPLVRSQDESYDTRTTVCVHGVLIIFADAWMSGA